MQNRIKEQIQKSGMMQKEVAEKLGMSTVGLSQLANVEMPKMETFAKIAAVLGVPAWKLCLSDAEIEEIRGGGNGYGKEEEGGGGFRCPRCGASLMIVPCSDDRR